MEPPDDVDYFLLSKAGKYIPGRPHRATIWRWATTGVVRAGRTIRLHTAVCGGRRFTTLADIQKFRDDCNDLAADPGVAPATERADAAARELESRGIG